MDFDNSFVLFVHFFCLNKQHVKSVYDLHSAIREIINILKYKMLHILKIVAKTCEQVLRLNMDEVSKMKVTVKKSHNIPVIDFNYGRHKDLSNL